MKYKKVLLLFSDYAGGYFGALRPPAGIGYLNNSSHWDDKPVFATLGFSAEERVKAL